MNDSFILAELRRVVTNLARIGTVVAVDYAKVTAKVSFDGITTGWLPYPAVIGRNFRGASPLRVGTQVLVVCPCGDLAQGIIAQILHRGDQPPSSIDPTVDQVRFEDGTTVTYDSASHAMTIAAVGDVTVTAAGNAVVKAANLARLDGRDVQIHASNSYSFDVDGYGQRITSQGGGAYEIHTWQDGAAVTAKTSGIAPPEGP